MTWRDRENARFASGEYKLVPWAWSGEPWWTAKAVANVDGVGNHFAHVSTDDPSKLAYTQSEDKGERDIQTRMKPGKYLRKYFADVLSDKDIAYWAGQFAGANEAHNVEFATSPEAIQHVYANGPRSCMSGEECVRVYGAGDLAVAYLSREGEITARVLCWPARKHFGRVYGDAARLETALESQGYSRNPNFDGARLLKEENPSGSGYLMPYVDGACCYVTDRGDHWTLGQNGESRAQSTSGVLGGGPTCGHCGEEADEEDNYYVNGETWCYSCCESDAFFCENCEESCRLDGARYYVDGETWCYGCWESDAFFCENCEESCRLNGARKVRKEGDNGRIETGFWCPYCFDSNASKCEACDEYAAHECIISTADDASVCRSCAENGETFFCERCEADYYVGATDCTDVSGEVWCETCAKKPLKWSRRPTDTDGMTPTRHPDIARRLAEIEARIASVSADLEEIAQRTRETLTLFDRSSNLPYRTRPEARPTQETR